MYPKLGLLAAYDQQRGLGKEGKLPWHIKQDLRQFKKLTMGKVVVMGRKTWESLPSTKLPGRLPMVLSRDPGLVLTGARVIARFEPVLALASTMDVWVIGGSEIFRLFLPYAGFLHLSLIERLYDCDVFFPPFSAEDYRLTYSTSFIGDQTTPDFSYKVFQRITPP